MVSDRNDKLILIAGGDADPNLQALLHGIRQQGLSYHALLVGANSHPCITWDMASNQLLLDGAVIHPKAAFIRHDVFTQLADQKAASSHRSLSWYTAIMGWLLSNPDIKLLNRHVLQRLLNKPYILHLAQQVGLKIPTTLITNDLAQLSEWATVQPMIAKPINGGGYCQSLDQLLMQTPHMGSTAAAPAIVQSQLIQPDVRVYGVGQNFFAFAITSNALDYRSTQNLQLEPIETVPADLLLGLKRLMEALQLDFGAADFKTCPETGCLRFLEINSSPMFAAFDQADNQKINRAILAYLTSEVSTTKLS